ncbi:hypothetical protein QBC40DRAFT_289425 [Triangularia verruculosa]|uniref:Uncharacterized protein n=1 Tax=Triangularia verruculosa TaxID=2587418 RepID=A0AAN6X9C5_9PEZI|nr:hypothetical protein QBC40DRAFT_289425 [Triangularia verruculosa]
MTLPDDQFTDMDSPADNNQMDMGDGTPSKPLLDKNGMPRIVMTPEERHRILRQLSFPVENLTAPFWVKSGGDNSLLAKQIAASLNIAHIMAKRPLRTEEANAVANFRTTYVNTMELETPVWLATTLALEYRGRNTLRFPLYTPNPEKYNISAFPSLANPKWTGEAAARAWRLARLGAYGFVANIWSIIMFASFANTSYSVKLLRMFKESEEQHKHRREMGDGYTQDRVPQQDYQREQQQEATPQQPAQQYQPPRWAQRAQTPPKPETPQSFEDHDGFLFDDASPVAQTQRDAARSSTGTKTGHPPPKLTNSWEKIREAAKAGESPATWGRDNQAAPVRKSESYTYTENERDYAKEQAQKDFDAMLERERSGKTDAGNRRY